MKTSMPSAQAWQARRSAERDARLRQTDALNKSALEFTRVEQNTKRDRLARDTAIALAYMRDLDKVEADFRADA